MTQNAGGGARPDPTTFGVPSELVCLLALRPPPPGYAPRGGRYVASMGIHNHGSAPPTRRIFVRTLQERP
ncbi:MAG: hypothetical protein U0360_11135, partial [Dehalococcoidia bacterium]